MLVTSWVVKKSVGLEGYRTELVCEGESYRAVCGGWLGAIMSSFREQLRLVAEDHGEQIARAELGRTGPIMVEEWTVEPLVTQGGYRVWMRSGRFEYTALTDGTLESVIMAMQGAMKFFAMKYGIIEVDPEVARNRDRAEELRRVH